MKCLLVALLGISSSIFHFLILWAHVKGEREEKGVQSEYHGNLNCVHTHSHTSTDICASAAAMCHCCLYMHQAGAGSITLASRPREQNSKRRVLLNLSSCLGGSVFLYSGSAVLSWRFFPQVATFLLISRIKSTFCFKPVIWLQTCLITVDAPAVWILSWAWLLAVACLVWV